MNKPLSLYIHIPFCVKKCLYCDFVSFQANDASKEKYLDRLTEELAFYAGICGNRVSSVFIGGGTPTSLSSGQLQRLTDSVNRFFDVTGADTEYTVEANPGTLDAEKVRILKTAGVNRISMGLQSIFDDELKMLGRVHDYNDFLRSYDLVKNAGVDNINIDLMSALPGADVSSWSRTLETVADMDVQHISAYSLIIEEGTPFGRIYGDGVSEEACLRAGKSFDKGTVSDTKKAEETERNREIPDKISLYPLLPDEETERQMYHITNDILSAHGFHQYEISNYAKEGYECRHNISYWKGGYYIGAGLAAAGHLPASFFGENGRSVRYKNTADLNRYLSSAFFSEADNGIASLRDMTGKKQFLYKDSESMNEKAASLCRDSGIIDELEPVTALDAVKERFIFGLRMNEGTDIVDALELASDPVFSKNVYASIEKLEKDALIEVRDGRVRLTDRGRDLENYVVSYFI